MEIEAGKTYRNRNGGTSYVKLLDGPEGYGWADFCVVHSCGASIWHYLDGTSNVPEITTGYDLIEEVKEDES